MTGTGTVPGPVRKKARHVKSAQLSGKQGISERAHSQSEERPILDERVPGLIFDSLATVQAALVSASKEMPYGALRQAMALGEQEKRELTSAAHAVAAKYPAFFSKHKDGLEFVAALMAINAAKIDQLFSLIDHLNGPLLAAEPSASEGHVCSAPAALGIALIVLAPLWLLAVVLILEHIRR
jgi:hypothetical protein